MIKEKGTILIPIDFSNQSLLGIQSAFNLARFSQSKLFIMHVFQKFEDEDKAGLEALAKKTALESGLVCEYGSVKGDIFEETDKMAVKIDANLIVVGLDPLVRFSSFMGKSTASKFIKNSPCPVLTTRSKTYKSGCKNILMPIDLSAESREKVSTVIQLAKYFGADIRIVSVFDPSDSKYEDEILPYIQQVKKFIKEKHVNCSNKSIPSKNVAEVLVEYANKNDCDLIVQMNKKDIALGEMFSGTMSQKIVDISNVPVLSINPMKRVSISSSVH